MNCSAYIHEDRASLDIQVAEILAPYGLLGAYLYVRNENPSNNLPYHNLHHTHCLVIQCADGAAEMKLEEERRRTLLLSALFHDFGHSGGKCKDDQNIKVAVAWLKAFCDSDRYFEDCLAEATAIIESTEFPPVAEPVTLSEKIIRDADRMQIFMPGWREQIFGGLRKEIGVATGKEISISEMVRLQLKFMNSVEWQTSWAARRAAPQWASLIEQVKRFELEE